MSTKMFSKLCLTVVLVLIAATTQAATKYWQGSDNLGADGAWNTAGFWSASGIPAAADTPIYIGNSSLSHPGTGASTISGYSTPLFTGTIDLGENLGDTGTVTVGTTGVLQFATSGTRVVNVGDNGAGVFNLNTGGLLTRGSYFLGNLAGSTGTMNVRASSLASSITALTVGNSGSGTFNEDAGSGTLTTGTLTAGNAAGVTGTMNISAAFTASTPIIGNSGTGTMNIHTGATVLYNGTTTAQIVKLGAATAAGAAGLGTINIDGGTLTNSNFTAGVTLGYGAFSNNTSAGYINQSGGTVTINTSLVINRGAYVLSGGALSTGAGAAGTLNVGSINNGSTATFTQNQLNGTSTYNDRNGMNVGVGGGTGIYTLNGGTITATNNNSLSYFAIGAWEGTAGGSSNGKFYIGDPNGVFSSGNPAATGTITGTAGSDVIITVNSLNYTVNTGVGMIVRQSSAASGLLEGYGVVGLMGTLTNNGVVRANGYGHDANVLDMSSFKSFTNNSNVGGETFSGSLPTSVQPSAFANTGGQGWFATNHGELLLPFLAVNSASTYNWGGDPTTSNYVNSLSMSFAGTVTNGNLSIALLSTDRADVPAVGQLVDPIGVWKFDPGTLAFGSASLTFRYDDAMAASLSVNQNDLGLWGYDTSSSTWVSIPINAVDTTNKLVTTSSGIPSFYADFAIAEVPEPGTIVMLSSLGLSLGLLWWRRKRADA